MLVLCHGSHLLESVFEIFFLFFEKAIFTIKIRYLSFSPRFSSFLISEGIKSYEFSLKRLSRHLSQYFIIPIRENIITSYLISCSEFNRYIPWTSQKFMFPCDSLMEIGHLFSRRVIIDYSYPLKYLLHPCNRHVYRGEHLWNTIRHDSIWYWVIHPTDGFIEIFSSSRVWENGNKCTDNKSGTYYWTTFPKKFREICCDFCHSRSLTYQSNKGSSSSTHQDHRSVFQECFFLINSVVNVEPHDK